MQGVDRQQNIIIMSKNVGLRKSRRFIGGPFVLFKYVDLKIFEMVINEFSLWNKVIDRNDANRYGNDTDKRNVYFSSSQDVTVSKDLVEI